MRGGAALQEGVTEGVGAPLVVPPLGIWERRGKEGGAAL